jgi:ADP-heptose:LPS heptosyltransferase
MMFPQFRHSLGLFATQFQLRKSPDQVVSFTSAVSSSKMVLVILPFNTLEAQPTNTVIEFLNSRFRGENITVVSSSHSVEVIRALPRSQFLRIVPDDIGPFFLPRKECLSRVRARPCDLAIDLNLDFLLPSGYICRASGARVRVGFSRESAELFYNFLVRPEPTLARKLIYDRLANCLEKF